MDMIGEKKGKSQVLCIMVSQSRLIIANPGDNSSV
jgi:hypothetical protein